MYGAIISLKTETTSLWKNPNVVHQSASLQFSFVRHSEMQLYVIASTYLCVLCVRACVCPHAWMGVGGCVDGCVCAWQFELVCWELPWDLVDTRKIGKHMVCIQKFVLINNYVDFINIDLKKQMAVSCNSLYTRKVCLNQEITFHTLFLPTYLLRNLKSLVGRAWSRIEGT